MPWQVCLLVADLQQLLIDRMFSGIRWLDAGGKEHLIVDRGTQPASAIAVMAERGCCEEEIYPYAESLVNVRPPSECDLQAKKYRIVSSIPVLVEINAMKRSLADGYPFVFGLQTFKSFDKANETKGLVPMPDVQVEMDYPGHGWHSMLAVGYSDERQAFIVMNSWGTEWGDQGYCYIPYAYMSDRSLCLCLRAITEINVPAESTLLVDAFADDSRFRGEKSPTSKVESSEETPVLRRERQREQEREQERGRKETRPADRLLILWIDQDTEEHRGYINDLQQTGLKFEVHFSSTYANGERYLHEHKEAIQTSHRFVIVCRGYFKDEQKNPFDLLQYLHRNDLTNQPTIVFTGDKRRLTDHLDKETESNGMTSWRRSLEITAEKNELIKKITYYLTR